MAVFLRWIPIAAVAILLPGFDARSAHSAVVFHLGEVGEAQFLSPSRGSIVADQDFTVVEGIELTNFPDAAIGSSLNFSRNLLEITFDPIVSPTAFAGSEATVGTNLFNGFRIADATDNIASFLTVTVDPTSSLAGSFGTNRIEFNENEAFFDFQGIAYADNDNIRFFFNGGPAVVPEPGSMALLGLMSTGIAYRRWTRRRKAQA